MELALDDDLCDCLVHGSLVSILVFVELALDVDDRAAAVAMPIVSILVFVELALDDSGYIDLALKRQSFNPCFRGTCS